MTCNDGFVLTKEDNSLTHIAIIMDGNGRWAAKRGLPRSFGHKKGAERLKKLPGQPVRPESVF